MMAKLKRSDSSVGVRCSRLQRLFDCCRQVFRGPGTVPSPHHVKKLCHILDGMKAEDVGLRRDVGFFNPKTTTPVEASSAATARVTSSTIYRCQNFELCIFFIPANGVIPLHNHPEMTVLTKLLLGSMHVKAYDWVDHHPSPSSSSSSLPYLRLAKVKVDAMLRSRCSARVLYPTTGGNIHELRAVTPCAVLDVLAPPYSKLHARDCSYCIPHSTFFSSGKEEYGWLEEIDEIPEMDAIEYRGPHIIHP